MTHARALLTWIVSSLALTCLVRAEVLDTWIIAGQSNAEGYGITESPVTGLLPASTLSTIGRSELNITHANIQIFQGANEYSGITASAGMTLPAKNAWHSMNAQEGLAYDWGSGKGSESGRRFGPELAYGYDVQAQMGAPIALIKYARGSASIASSSTQNSSVWLDYDPSDGGRLNHYDKLITTIQTAVDNLPAGRILNVRGVIWMQGEGDATATFAPAYQTNLTEFITTLRNDIGTIAAASGGKMTRSASAWSELDVFLGTIQNSGANHQTVINAQNAVAAADTHVHTVNATTGLSLMTSDDWNASGVHYDTAGQVLLGERFADAALAVALPGYKADPFGGGTIKMPTTAAGGTGTAANVQADDDVHYTVAKAATATIGGFGTQAGTISSVYLFVQYSVEAGYTGTNAIQVNGVNTPIVPAVRDYGRWGYVDITGGGFGIDTSAEIASLSVTFNNNDGGTSNAVLFDCVYVVVNPQTAISAQPTWSEDFNGSGQANPMVWNYEVGYQRNNELQYYVPGATNGWMESGNFIIEGRRESIYAGHDYTSASIVTNNKYYWKYGRAQIRAKIPCLPGMWPAIWGTGEVGNWPHNGEVDILEFYNSKILANCAVGTGAAWTAKWDTLTPDRSMTSLVAVEPNWKTRWHIWTMQWDADNVRLYVDNVLMGTIPQSVLKNTDGYDPAWGPQYPFISNGMSCWLNLAIGGAGGDPSSTAFPQRYLIDYWKIWEGATGNVAATDIAVSGNGVTEGKAIGTVAGTLSATDADPGEVHRFTLVAGAGDTHNSQFTIPEFVTNSTTQGFIKTAAVLNYIDGATRSIRVRVTDIEGATYDKILTINVESAGQHVTYDANGSTGGSVPYDPAGYPQGSTVTVLGNTGTLVRTGYAFSGWNTAANGSGTTYAGGSTFVMGAANVTLYAKWTAVSTYTVSYNGNSQSSGTAPGSQTKTQGVNLTLATNSGNLARSGYTFDGWNTMANGTGTNYATGANYTVDANLTLYAKWNVLPVADAGATQTVNLSAGQSWTPASATPVAWYDAADAASITHVSGAVSQWNDKSGNARHVVQATSANQPTYSASSWNGSSLPALTFDGTTDYLENSTQFVSSTLTIAAVYDQSNTNNSSRPFGVRNGGSGKASFAFASDNSLRYDGTYTSGTIAASVGKHLRVAGRTTSAQTDHIDGTSNISAAVVLPNIDGNINIGNTLSTLTGYFSSKVAEAVIIPGTVTQATREQIEGYLAHKWGLTADLPALHPYKSTAPSTSSATATLAGSASDAEGASLTTTWSMVSGPATVTFGNALALNSTAIFPVAGTYTLRLTVHDGLGSTSDDVVVTVDAAGSGYTITFDSVGGSAVAPITQDSGTAVTAPSAPTKTGYTFTGWTPVVPSTMPASNTTCVAQWTANGNASMATYRNLAKYQKAIESTYGWNLRADRFATDGRASNFHRWRSTNSTGQWLEIHYPRQVTLASTHLYTGVIGSTTAENWANFKLQYDSGGTWMDIPGGSRSSNTLLEVNIIFSQAVTSDKFRLLSTDAGSAVRSIREIAMFGPNVVNSVEQGYPIGTEVNLNFAHKFPATASSINGTNHAIKAVDGYVDDSSRWLCNSGAAGEWLEIDLLSLETNGDRLPAIGSAHLYSGDFATSNGALSAFTLQYWDGAAWLAIPGATITGNTSNARVIEFSSSVVTSKVRLINDTTGSAKVAELLFFPPRAGGYALGQNVRMVAPPTSKAEDFADATRHLRVSSASLKLGLVGGNGVFTNDTAGTDALNWQLLLNHRDGSYRIRNVKNGQCLALATISTASNTLVIGENYTGMPHQCWFLDFVNATQFRLINAYSGLALQSLGGSTTPGTALAVVTPGSSTLQQWDTVWQTHHPKKGIGGTPLAHPDVPGETWMSFLYGKFQHTSWCYSWSRTDVFPYLGAENTFSPMQEGNYNWTHASNGGPMDTERVYLHSQGKPAYMMGFNEPDTSTVVPVSVADAVTLWPRFMAMDTPLVAPCPANPLANPQGFNWNAEFYTAATPLGYRMDYVPLHWYDGPSSNNIINKIKQLYGIYGRPIWVTEFSTVRWSGTATWTHASNYNFLAEFMWRAENLPEVARYALFNFKNDPLDPTDPAEAPRGSSLGENGTLTPFGELYASWDGVAQILPQKAYHLHNHGFYQRMQSPASGNSFSFVTPDNSTAGTQWFLTPGTTSDTFRIQTTRDGRRLVRSSGNPAAMGALNQMDTTTEWRLTPVVSGADHDGWYYLDHPLTNQRLKNNGDGTCSMVATTDTTNGSKWRFIVPLVPDMQAVAESTTVLVNQSALIDVLANDSGRYKAPTIQSVGTPTAGTAVIENGQIRYTPPNGFSGSVQFTYTITDGTVTDSALVTITVRSNQNPTVDAGPYQAVLLDEIAALPTVPGAYFEWDAANDTAGNDAWTSTTANTYNWTFDFGNQTPANVTDSRFLRLSKAYVFPAAKDGTGATFDPYGSNQRATFEFVLDVDGDNGSIFETGGSGTGMQVDVVGGVLRGTVSATTPARATYTLTPTDKGRFIHVVFVADNVADVVQLYVDGVLRDTQPWTLGDDWSGGTEGALGGMNYSVPTGGSSADFNGKLALFRFYNNKAFTAGEVTTNMNSLIGEPAKTVALDGTVADGDADPLTTTWEVVSGPATVAIGDASAVDTTATFSLEGTYTLRLTANDGIGSSSDDVVITVNPVGSNYTITFDSAGGSAVSPITQASGTSVTAPTAPTKTGYTFAGWTPAVPSTMPASNTTCVAQWTANSYTITFNSVGGTAVSAITQAYGTAVTGPAAPTKLGYTLAGWTPAVPSTMPASNTTCVAQWTANSYTITFNSAGGTAVSSITQIYGTAVTAPTAPTKTGYTFAGWVPTVPATMPTDTTCVAQWTTNSYTVTFDKQSGTGGSDSVSAIYGSAMPTAIVPIRTGYTFGGYYSGVDGGGTQYYTAVMTSAATWNLTTATTLYAKWSLGTPTLSHVSNTHISNSTDFNISVYPGKAGYAGTGAYAGATGTFGDGTVEAYYFIKNQTPATILNGSDGVVGTPIRYTDDGGTRLSTVTISGGTSFSEFSRGDVWTTNDPGTNFSGGGAANYGGATETISGAYATTGTIDISGFTSGTIYFLAGGYATNPQTTGFNLTMSGAGQTNVTASNTFAPTTSRNMYVQSFTFSNAENYSTISYNHFGTTSGRSRIMGVVLDGVTSVPPSNTAPVWTSNPITGNNATQDIAYSGSIASSATDADNDPLTYAKVSGPAWLSVAANGTLSGTPANSDAGVNAFTVSVSDGTAPAVTATLNITVKTAYETWATAQGLTGNDALPGADKDGDGLNNLIEYAFGTHPNVAGGGALAYVASGAITNPGQPIARDLNAGAGVEYHAIFSRRKDHVAAGITYTVQFSASLNNDWENSIAIPTILTGDNTQNPGDIEVVSVPYPLSIPVSGGFFRVIVSMP